VYIIPEPVVVLLAGGVPERQLNRPAVQLDVGHVSLEHGRHVLDREFVLAEHDQQARLAALAVADHHQLLAHLQLHAANHCLIIPRIGDVCFFSKFTDRV